MFKKILIIGCGLIGSSILRASINKKISKKFFVYEKSKKNIKSIKKINSKIIFLKKLDKEISDIDFILICTPMSQYKNILPFLKKNLSKKSIITDVSSTKQNIVKLKNSRNYKFLDWITSHPISGSEVSGPEYGNKNLFLDKWCIIVRDKNRSKFDKVIKFWKKIGSNIMIMNEKNHDKIFSITSHLPHLVAYNLIKTAQDFQKKQKKDIIKFSAGGLRDFSRIAASNEIMWRDIFFSNKRNLISAINLFSKNLNSFKKNIQNLDNKKLISKLKNSKKARQQIINLKQDIAKPDFGRDQN